MRLGFAWLGGSGLRRVAVLPEHLPDDLPKDLAALLQAAPILLAGLLAGRGTGLGAGLGIGLGGCGAMSHLALFLPSLRGGGAERVMVQLANGFAARGHRVDLVLLRAEGPYLAELAPGVRLVDLRARRALTGLLPLARYLRRARPQALMSALAHANVIAIWARLLAGGGLRLVVSERNSLTGLGVGARGRVLRWLMRHSYPRADRVIAVSGGIAAELAEGLGLDPARLAAIPNPVDLERIAAQAAAELPHPWLAPGQPPVVLAVGRLEAQKDYPLLLNAFALLRAGQGAKAEPKAEADAAPPELSGRAVVPETSGRVVTPDVPDRVVVPDVSGRVVAPEVSGRAVVPDVPGRGVAPELSGGAARLIILGEGSQRAALTARIRALGLGSVVLLPGFVANPYAWMARCRVFVLASRFEGFPNVLLQALACGAPVVSTDCPTGPSEILAGGRWGRLVPLADAPALAAALEAALRETEAKVALGSVAGAATRAATGAAAGRGQERATGAGIVTLTAAAPPTAAATITGAAAAEVSGDVCDDVPGPFTEPCTGPFTGSRTEPCTGSRTGSCTGPATGAIPGAIPRTISGGASEGAFGPIIGPVSGTAAWDRRRRAADFAVGRVVDAYLKELEG